ncbi:MAG: porin family protein [Planctomycetaceae bacterium]|nr:porin family protein [Planctomycetaceae bacterium]MBT6485797.1 porin family protein [Planctomycetaceae bacterium]
MMRVVWVAVIAVGALFAGSQTSRAQYGGGYPPPNAPPVYTQRQVIPDLPPTVNLQEWTNTFGGPTTPVGPNCPPQFSSDRHTGYANERNVATGWYISGMMGAVYLEDQHSEALDVSLRREEDAAFEWNINGGATIGYRLPPRPHDLGQLRIEFDTIFNKNDVKTLLFNSVERNPRGEVSSQSFLFNLVIDFIHWGDVVTPYIGGGAGFMRVDESLEYGRATFVDEDYVFAFQGMAGISVQLSENIQWFTEWRYLGGSNPTFTRNGPPAPTQVDLRSEYNTHSIMSGIRIDLR